MSLQHFEDKPRETDLWFTSNPMKIRSPKWVIKCFHTLTTRNYTNILLLLWSNMNFKRLTYLFHNQTFNNYLLTFYFDPWWIYIFKNLSFLLLMGLLHWNVLLLLFFEVYSILFLYFAKWGGLIDKTCNSVFMFLLSVWRIKKEERWKAITSETHILVRPFHLTNLLYIHHKTF